MRKFWSQTHWLLGIIPGLVLAVVGVTGAMLSFEHEILRAINPGVMTVTPGASALAPQDLLDQARAQQPGRTITNLELETNPHHAARVGFAPQEQPKGRRARTEWRYQNPYTGELLDPPRGQAFFRTTQQLHRYLAAGDVGKQIVGASTVALLVLALSGLYLRWPRRLLDWRAWLTFNPRLKGRAFLWHLHAVAGTWVFLFYLLAGLTGLYWSYEWYRNGLFALSGAERPSREAVTLDAPAAGTPDLAAVMARLHQESTGYSKATLTLPRRPDQALEIRYLPADPAHERAYNRLILHPTTARVITHERYIDKPLGARLMGSMLPLHSGSYFGVGGTALMMIASLLMPLFTVTGWILYLKRRTRKRRRAAAPIAAQSPSP